MPLFVSGSSSTRHTVTLIGAHDLFAPSHAAPEPPPAAVHGDGQHVVEQQLVAVAGSQPAQLQCGPVDKGLPQLAHFRVQPEGPGRISSPLR